MKIKTNLISEKELYSGIVDTLVIKEFYDLHGMSIPEGVKEKNYKQAKFRIIEQKREWCWSNSKDIVTDYKLVVNDEIAESWLTAYEYDPNTRKLIIRACTGTG